MTSTKERERDAAVAASLHLGSPETTWAAASRDEDALMPGFPPQEGLCDADTCEPGASRLKNDPIHGLKSSWRRKRAAKQSKRRPFRPDFSGLEPRTLLATFLVTTTADSGSSPLSLRQAIIDSNATPGLNTIHFSIGAVGSQQTIAPASALPSITNPVFIDGWSQGGAGYTGAPLIVIDGTDAGTGSDGLDLETGSDGSTIRGLVINDFGGAGISITTSGNLVESSYIGTDVSGTVAAANGTGVEIASGGENNTIGGTTTAARTSSPPTRIPVWRSTTRTTTSSRATLSAPI